MNVGRFFRVILRLLMLGLWSITVLFTVTRCKGKSGPAGADAFLTDSLPPRIEWVFPPSGITVDTLLLLHIRAEDDQSIRQVIFSIGGWETAPDSAHTDSLNRSGDFYYTWRCASFPSGRYPLVSIVWDQSYLYARTPVHWVIVSHP